jgi:hypothetical protein
MPTGGLNFVDNTLDFPATDAYVLDNILAKPFGCEIRKGWRNWMPAASNLGAAVRSILVYTAEKSSNSELFCSAATNPSYIRRITTQNTAPSANGNAATLTPSTNSDIPGEWYYANLVTIGGNFLLCVSAGAGYYYFKSPAGVDSWTEVITGDGVAANTIKFPAGDSHTTKDICFVWIWKNRVWFLVRNSAVAYYLPVTSLSGILQAFDFGQQLDMGGSLQWACNWTYDSGSGIDDSLVLVSDQGQMLVYTGTDPSNAATFSQKGCWFAGRQPVGRRNFCEHGGQVMFLCEYGIVNISDLVSGRLHTSNLSGTIGWKVNPRLASLVSSNLDQPIDLVHNSQGARYWTLMAYPTEELLYLGTPLLDINTGLHQHMGMNSLTNAWSTFSNIDALSMANYQGQMIYGTSDGLVNQAFYGYADNQSADGALKGDYVTARSQGAFHDFGSPNMNKRMLRIKLYGLSNTPPAYFARFRAEYDLSTPIDAPNPEASIYPLWDDAIWDQAIWAQGDGSFHRWYGVTGYGKKLSLQLAMRGAGHVLATDHETLYEQGIGL